VKSSEFEFKKGPIFSNIILIDEINRAPAKTQAAMFETMEERQGALPQTKIKDVLSPTKLKTFKAQIQDIVVEEKIFKYIAEVVAKTRNHPHLYLGGSPRASIATLNSAKAFAAVNGRDFVTPEDVKKALVPVLNHRVILTPEREMEGMSTENVITMITESVEIPR